MLTFSLGLFSGLGLGFTFWGAMPFRYLSRLTTPKTDL